MVFILSAQLILHSIFDIFDAVRTPYSLCFFDYCASLDVDDVTENENDFVLETNLDSFNTILQKLENRFSIPKFSEIEWKPLNFIDISDEDSAKVLIKLLETLEYLDDVQSVSSNFNINDSLMDKII